MKEKNVPFVSIVMLSLLIIGMACTMGLDMDFVRLEWMVFAAELFLFECSFGLLKKTYASNIGVFIPIAAMGVSIIVTIVVDGGLTAALNLIGLAPPMFVALGANIGNMIYKKRKTALADNVNTTL